FGADHRGLVWDSIDSDFLDFGLIAHTACTGADEYGLDKKMDGGLPAATAGTNRFGGTDSYSDDGQCFGAENDADYDDMNDNNLPTDAGQCFEGDEDDPNYNEDVDPPGPSRLSVFALITCWGWTATCYVLLMLNNKILKTVLGLIMFGRSGGDACWRAINEFRCIVAMLVLAQAAVVRSAKLPAIDTSGVRDPVNGEEQGQ
ncbi:hypothetical protein TeGR_g7286, partial [Tetraparma gracilis]